MYTIEGNTLCETYHAALVHLQQSGKWVSCPEYSTRYQLVSCRELINVGITIHDPASDDSITKLGIFTPKDLDQYKAEVLDGIRDGLVSVEGLPYTYHARMTESYQLSRAIKALRKSVNSRRAVITLRKPTDSAKTEQPCLTAIQFLVRDGKLHMTVYFRSNDLWNAFFMNAYALIELQKKVAKELEFEVGEYTHIVGSLHVYNYNYDQFRAAVGRAFTANNQQSLCYSAQEWEDAR